MIRLHDQSVPLVWWVYTVLQAFLGYISMKCLKVSFVISLRPSSLKYSEPGPNLI